MTQASSRLRFGAERWEPATLFWNAPDRNDTGAALWYDAKQTVFVQIYRDHLALLFKDKSGDPGMDKNFTNQAVFRKTPKMTTVDFTYHQENGRVGIYYGLNGTPAIRELPASSRWPIHSASPTLPIS